MKIKIYVNQFIRFSLITITWFLSYYIIMNNGDLLIAVFSIISLWLFFGIIYIHYEKGLLRQVNKILDDMLEIQKGIRMEKNELERLKNEKNKH